MQKGLRTITLKTAVDSTQPDRCAAGASRLCVKKELVQLPNLG